MSIAPHSVSNFLHRIGAVSHLSGIPVSTLRIWEVRYNTFEPVKTQGKHRLYSDDDVLKASLLKQLTQWGHAISSLARLSTPELNHLIQQDKNAHTNILPEPSAQASITVNIVGLPLAGRIASQPFAATGLQNTLQVLDIYTDLATALNTDAHSPCQLLMVRINSLQSLVQADIQRLSTRCRTQKLIVIYNFGQQWVIEAMRNSGILVRREPISDSELADLIRSVTLIDARKTLAHIPSGGIIPPRQYSDETLMRVASITSKVLCECPRHVAEIITQLTSFEQYSTECLSRTAEDAHLHAYLSAISGSARALFEQALQKIAQHEGISLTDPGQ